MRTKQGNKSDIGSGPAVIQMRDMIASGLTEVKRSPSADLTLEAWTRRYRPNLAEGRPMDWDRHSFLGSIYDMHRDESCKRMVFYKAGQVGISELMVSYALWSGDSRNATVLYLFPSDRLISDFSAERLQPAIQVSTHLSTIVKEGNEGQRMGVNRVTLKRIGNRFFYLRGTKVDKEGDAPQLKSIAADVVIFDEVDSMDQRALPLAEKRLGHSSIAEQRFVSTPSYTDRGIHALYKRSDMRVCKFRCGSCSEWNEITLESLVTEWDQANRPVAWHLDDDGNPCTRCHRCGGVITRREEFEWVAEYPSRADYMVGFHLSKFITPFVDLLSILNNLQSSDPSIVKECMNQDVGVPYTPTGGGINLMDLRKRIEDYPLGFDYSGLLYMGVDVGGTHSVVIRDLAGRMVYACEADGFDRIGELIRQYNPVTVVIDALPETESARKLQDDFPPGQIWLCYYQAAATKRKSSFQYQSGLRKTISADRLRVMDKVAADFSGKDIISTLPNNIAGAVPDYLKHMCAPVRLVEKDSSGNNVASWVSTTADHYYHAEVYCWLAAQRPTWNWEEGMSKDGDERVETVWSDGMSS